MWSLYLGQVPCMPLVISDIQLNCLDTLAYTPGKFGEAHSHPNEVTPISSKFSASEPRVMRGPPWKRRNNKEQDWVAFMSQPYWVKVMVEVELRLTLRLRMIWTWGWNEVEMRLSRSLVEIEFRLSWVGVGSGSNYFGVYPYRAIIFIFFV